MNAASIAAFLGRTQSRLSEDARSRNGVLILLGCVLALVAPLVVTSYAVSLLTQLVIIVLVVGSWILVAGYFGIFTFAHAAFYGIGAYGAAIAAAGFGVHPVASILLGGLAAALFSLPIAYPVLKLSGPYVAMVTLAYGEIIFYGTTMFRGITGGPTGYTGFPQLFGGDDVALFYFVFAVVAVLMLAQYGLLVNRFGLVARAIRESSDAASMLGNNVPRYKLVGFVVGSSIAGVGGALQAYTIMIISPPMLELNQMIELMAMGVIGGLRTFGGAAFGGVIVFGLSESLRGLGQLRLVIWGVMLVAVTLYFPNGLAGESPDVIDGIKKRLGR